MKPVDPHPIPYSEYHFAFSPEEYEVRRDKVCKTMAEQDIDVLLVTFINSACYLTGYQTPLSNWDICIALSSDGEMVAHVTDLEVVSLFMHGGWPKDAPCYCVPYHKYGDAYQRTAEMLKLHGWSNKRFGMEMSKPGCTHGLVKTLTEELPDASFVDASRIVLDCRMVKSPAELKVMRQAGIFSRVGIMAVMESVRAGVTDGELTATAFDAMFRAGSEYLSLQPFVKVGDATWLEHTSARRRVVLPGGIVTCEMTGVYERYSCPIYRTATVGKPSDDVSIMLDTANATLEKLFELAKPGVPAKEVALELKSICTSKLQGRATPKDMYGYSVGIGFPPDWVEGSFYIDIENEAPLQAGMTFHSPHAFRDKVRRVGACFSETWVVTENGGEVLGCTPRELKIAY